jgi:O-antigen/teichoic acid export membrane protein
VGLGLFALGISASVYLVLAGRAVGPAVFAGLAVQWTLIYTLGVGLFVPFEQEIAREVAGRRATGDGPLPVVSRAALAAASVCAGVAVLVLATLPWLYDVVYFGSPAIVVGLLLALAGLAAQHLQRGTFSGSEAFGWYATQIGVEGVLRTVGTLGLYVAGVHSIAPYALLVGVAPLLSALVVSVPFARLAMGQEIGQEIGREIRRGSPVAWRDLGRNIAWLLAAALAAQGLANLGTVAVRVLGRSLPDASAGHFLSGLIVARLPLFVFAVIQVALLPRLARTLADGRHRHFRSQLLVAASCTAGLAVAGVAGSFVAGTQVLQLLFGPDFDLPRGQLTLMAVGTGLYMVALVLQPAVVALGGHRAVAVAWITGLTTFGLVLALPVNLFDRVVLALILGGAATAAVLAGKLFRELPRAGDRTLQWDPAVDRAGME